MKSNKTKSAMTALVIAAMICTAAMPVKAEESKWVNNDGNWSLIKADGKKATGWVKDGECWYAFDENGSMRTGWVASHEHWYYMGESGVMQVNTLVEDNGAKYFVKGTGVMAKDYVKDGYEFTSDGKAIPLSESKSVVLTDAAELEGKVIEGNLYVDVTTAKEIELKGVTVKGKLIIIGDNETAGKVTLTDSKVETIHTQSRNSEVVLSGDTEVKNIVIEETAKVTTDKDYKGKVENFEIQSTAKGTVVVEVPAENVSTRTYATVDVQAPVGNLEVKTDTQVKVNANVKNVTVTETAKDTTVEVAKGSTVGTITADAPVKIDGKGTVDKVEANVDGVEAGKDTTIKDVETGNDVTDAPDVTKPDKGGSSGGGDYTPTIVTKTVTTLAELTTAVSDTNVAKILITENITLPNEATLTIAADRNVEINIAEGKTLTLDAAGNPTPNKNNPAYNKGINVEGTLKLTGSGTIKNISSYCTIYVASGASFVLDGANVVSHQDFHNEIIKNAGKMNFKSGTVGDVINANHETNVYVAGIIVGNEAELIMDNGIINSSWFGVSTNGTERGQKITINNGTITNLGKESNIFYFPQAYQVTITGGTFTGYDGGLEMRSGRLDITGGTFRTEYSKDNTTTNWGNGESGSFWSTIALGKPESEAYAGDLIANISGATIEALNGGDAIIFDTRYSEKNADNVEIDISNNNIVGKVKICEDEKGLEDWKSTNNKYHFSVTSGQVTSKIAIVDTEVGHKIEFQPFNDSGNYYEFELSSKVDDKNMTSLIVPSEMINRNGVVVIEELVEELTEEAVFDTLSIRTKEDKTSHNVINEISTSINLKVNISNVTDSFTVIKGDSDAKYIVGLFGSINNASMCVFVDCTCHEDENKIMRSYRILDSDVKNDEIEIDDSDFIEHTKLSFRVSITNKATVSKDVYTVNLKLLNNGNFQTVQE